MQMKKGSEMLYLKNVNHTFDLLVGDVGCTIRKGSKWAKVPIGETLELMNCNQPHQGTCGEDCKREGTGKAIGSWLGKFQELPRNLLQIEHNIAARDIVTLKEMLEVGYGSIAEDDIIIALVYQRTSD